MSMYGWLESGGATSATSFINTSPQDVVLRTSFQSNKLVLGNSNAGNAGMYIVGNNVGIAKIPEFTLDVHGDMIGDGHLTLNTNPNCNLDTSNITYTIDMTASNILFFAQTDKNTNSNNTKTMTLSSFGLIRNRMLVADFIRTKGQTLSNVYIEDVYPNLSDDHVTTGYTMILNAQYKDYFAASNTFVVDEVYFNVVNRIVNSSSNLIMNIRMPFAEQNAAPFPFHSNMEIDIQLLRNINPLDAPSTLVNLDYVYQDVKITHYEFLNPQHSIIRFNVTVDDRYDGFFKPGTFYHVKTVRNDDTMSVTPDNILILRDNSPVVQLGDITKITLTFEHPTQSDSLEEFIISLISRFNYTSTVAAVFFPLVTPRVPGMPLQGSIKVQVDSGMNLVDDTTVQYVITSTDDHLLNELFNDQSHKEHYIGKYLYTLDDAPYSSRIWTIEDYTPITLTKGLITLKLDVPIDVQAWSPLYNLNRSLDIIPFKYAKYIVVGDKKSTTYIPIHTKLGVGTYNVGEMLTVGGDISARENLYMYSDTASNGFRIWYASNELHLNDALSVDNRPTTAFPVQVQAQTHFTNNVKVSKEIDHLFFADGKYMTGQYGSSSNTWMDTFGTVDAAMLHATDLRTTRDVFQKTVIRSVSLQQTFQDDMGKFHTGVVMSITSSYAGKLRRDDILRLNRTLFKLVRCDVDAANMSKTLLLSMDWYFDQERQYYEKMQCMPFQQGDQVDIEVLRGHIWSHCKTVCVPFLVNTCTYLMDGLGVNSQLTLKGQVKSSIDSTTWDSVFFSVGRYFNLRSLGQVDDPDTDIDNVVILKGFTELGDHKFLLQFKAIDNITALDKTTIGQVTSYITPGEPNAIIYIYPLDSFFQPNRRQYPFDQHPLSAYPYPQYTDSNVTLGFASEHNNLTYLVMRNAKSLQSFFNAEARFVASPIDRLYFNDSFYDVGGLFFFQNHLLACAKRVNPNILTPYADTSVTYSFNGIPIEVIEGVFPTDNLFTMILTLNNMNTQTFNLLQLYVTHNIFVMDKYNLIWNLGSLEKSKTNEAHVTMTLFNTSANAQPFTTDDYNDLSQPRFIWIVPLKYFSFNVHGNSRYDNYMENRLGLGTHFIKEYLTVFGDMSFKDSMVINSDTSSTPFQITYCNERFEWTNPAGLVWQMTPSNINVFLDMDLTGNISARNFYTHSDRRLKKNIIASDPFSDLSTISQMNICDFEFIDSGDPTAQSRLQKGVIAQELEAVLPFLVTEKEGWLPNVFVNGKTDASGEHVELVKNTNEIGLSIGDTIKVILYGGHGAHVKVVGMVDMQLAIDPPLPPLSRVFVYGKRDTYKMVDNTYLFMTSINAIKALASEVSELKVRMDKLSAKST